MSACTREGIDRANQVSTYEDKEHIYLFLPSLHHLIAVFLHGMCTFVPCIRDLAVCEGTNNWDLCWTSPCDRFRLSVTFASKGLLYDNGSTTHIVWSYGRHARQADEDNGDGGTQG